MAEARPGKAIGTVHGDSVGLHASDAANAWRSLARAGLRVSALYSSDLERARQTAAAIARAHALPPQHDPRLRERHYGHFQGLTFDEAEHRHPENFRRFKARDPHFA